MYNGIDNQPDYRVTEYSAIVGYTLTKEQCDAIDEAAQSISVAYPININNARYHVLQIIRVAHMNVVFAEIAKVINEVQLNILSAFDAAFKANGRIVENMEHASSFMALYQAELEQNKSQREPKWWHGLEHVIERNTKRTHASHQKQSNTRGTYHYGNQGKQASYWRHPRTQQAPYTR